MSRWGIVSTPESMLLSAWLWVLLGFNLGTRVDSMVGKSVGVAVGAAVVGNRFNPGYRR